MIERKNPERRRGPEAERVKIEGMDWQEAVAKALRKPPPSEKSKTPKRKRK
jgi:hypothetical protein